MELIEIICLVAGALILTAGYALPMKGKKEAEGITQEQEQKIEEKVSQAVEASKDRIAELVEDMTAQSVEKTERTMERLSNEKIMAIQEYSDTVLEEIHKNHEEEVFLYDMLNSKHDTLVETVGEATKTEAQLKQTMQEASFTPMKQNASEEFEQVLPKFVTKSELTDPNVQLEDLLNRFKGAGKNGTEKAHTIKPLDAQEIEQEEAFTQEDVEGDYNKNEQILALYRTGKSDVDIAKELGLGVGEVKLVIELYDGLES